MTLRCRRQVALLLVALLVWGGAAAVRAQECFGDAGTRLLSRVGRIDANGYIHYRFRLSSTVSGPVASAFRAAAANWNNRPQSAIVIDVYDNNFNGEVDYFVGQSYDYNRTLGCAAWDDNTGVVNVDSTQLAPWAGQAPDLAALVLAHEIGHAIGLKEGGPGNWSIMNNPVAAPSCRQAAQNQKDIGAPLAPTNTDAAAAEPCPRIDRPIEQFPSTIEDWVDGCFERWLAETVWSCRDNACWPGDTTYTFLGYWCSTAACR